MSFLLTISDNASPTMYHLNFIANGESESDSKEEPHLIASKLSLRPPQLSSHPVPAGLNTSSSTASTSPAQKIQHLSVSDTPSRGSTPQPQAQGSSQPSSLTQSLAVNVPNAFKGLRKKLEGAVSSKSIPEAGSSKGGDIEVLMECDLGVMDFFMDTHPLSGSKEPDARRDLEELSGMRVVGNAWTGEVWSIIWEVEAMKVREPFVPEMVLKICCHRFSVEKEVLGKVR